MSDYHCNYKYNGIYMLRYNRDYAIIFGFGYRPLESDETFQMASSEAICGRDLQENIYVYNVYTNCM